MYWVGECKKGPNISRQKVDVGLLGSNVVWTYGHQCSEQTTSNFGVKFQMVLPPRTLTLSSSSPLEVQISNLKFTDI
jgi:hypothetical protein